MDDFISRKAALRAIENKRNEYVDKAWKPVVGGRYQQDELFTNAALGCRAAEEEVKTVPAADVKPVVRGHWIKLSRGDVCSECKYQTGRYEHGGNYCPDCGADMRTTEVKHD